jgi:hypothetical protein
VLDGLLHPHSSIPYVQMGRSIALYTVSLLSRDSCERAFIIQLMFLSLSSSWRRLAFVCGFRFCFEWAVKQAVVLLFIGMLVKFKTETNNNLLW